MTKITQGVKYTMLSFKHSGVRTRRAAYAMRAKSCRVKSQ